jgi:hypothetical protein
VGVRSRSDRFVEDRLHPVVHSILGEVFGDDLPEEPERVPFRVVHTWMGATD